MDSSAAPEQIDVAARALADGTRRQLLRLVRDGEVAAGDLAGQFPNLSRPAVSQHLRVLHDAGLVSVRAVGNHRLYRARVDGVTEVRRFIDEIWTEQSTRHPRGDLNGLPS
jgi:DNA-binding transcriptional ArsR family regulator